MKNVIDTKRKEKVLNDMDDVIQTSKQVRDFLLSEENTLAEKGQQLDFFKQVISANKNIVSATIVEISVQKLANYEEIE